MRDGVIYVATGEDYLDLARASAQSLRQVSPGLPADLFTDRPDAPDLAMFDRVTPVPQCHDRAKIDCLPLTRFERTLFLDADTLVLRDPAGLFDLLDGFEIAMCHDVRRGSALVQAGHRVTTPHAFPQLNSGVILYRMTAPVAAFLADWAARFHAAPEVRRDQVILHDLLWQTDLRLWVLPEEYNMRRVTVLDAWEPLDGGPVILHSHRLQDHMRLPGAARVRTLEEVRRLERAALAEEWAAAGGAPE